MRASQVLEMLPFRWHLWIVARYLPVLAKRSPLKRLLDFATPARTVPAYEALSAEVILQAVTEVTARPLRMRGRRCLREGLLAFRFLSLAGYRPVLHFGLLPDTARSDHPRAHCWVDLDGRTVLNPATVRTVELFSYNGQGVGSAPEGLRFEDADA
ncbi:MAG: lasso peptide biosynthesis B2 protein [Alphaproteobacteria bacterium]|nr:lasso peptide biosynthesis B2 protein [Alphaproteobacteria bacterium]